MVSVSKIDDDIMIGRTEGKQSCVAETECLSLVWHQASVKRRKDLEDSCLSKECKLDRW